MKGIGDINGDHYDDICMPLHLPDSTSLWTPVYFGGPDIDTIPDTYLLDEYGERTAPLNFVTHGDFNGDGIEDIVTGDGSLIWGDVVYVYLGSPWFNPVPDAILVHEGNVPHRGFAGYCHFFHLVYLYRVYKLFLTYDC